MNECYKCKHRGDVAGTHHSCCNHPSIKSIKEDPLQSMLAIFASVGRTPPMLSNSNELNIKANEHGIKKGWFNFPHNFDPVWLENCDGFEELDKRKHVNERKL